MALTKTARRAELAHGQSGRANRDSRGTARGHTPCAARGSTRRKRPTSPLRYAVAGADVAQR
eukprot:5333385-Pyramimonas_sp.AAC.1